MSKCTYAGTFVNPTTGWIVVDNPSGSGYIVAVKVSDSEILQELLAGEITVGQANELKGRGWRPHSRGDIFVEWEDADEWIQSTSEHFEEDYALHYWGLQDV